MPKTKNLYRVSTGNSCITDRFYVTAESLVEAVKKAESKCECYRQVLRVEYEGELR
jgi:hypothetical protein